jgi:hypothetical protein
MSRRTPPILLLVLTALLLAPTAGASGPGKGSGSGAHTPTRRVAPRGFEFRLRRLAHTPAAAAFQAHFAAAARADVTAELARALLSGEGWHLSAVERGLLRVPIILDRPAVRAAFGSLESGRRPSSAQRRLIAQTTSTLDQNRSLRALRRRGAQLQAHPAKLKNILAGLAGAARRAAPRMSQAATPSDPFTETEAALLGPTRVMGARSLAHAFAPLLTPPAAIAYFRSISPLALGAIAQRTFAAQRPAGARSSAAAGLNPPNCPATNQQLIMALMQSLSANLPSIEWSHAAIGAIPDWIKKRLTRPGSLRRDLRSAFVGQLAQQLALSLFAGAYPNVRDALIDCAVQRIELAPSVSTQEAGKRQVYKLRLYGFDGKQIFKQWIDDPEQMTIEPRGDASCASTPYGWECFSTKSGPYEIHARLRALSAAGRLKVEPGPPVTIHVTPGAATVGVGEESPTYVASGEDSYDNQTEDIVPGVATRDGVVAQLRIVPDGHCQDAASSGAATCTPQLPGPHNVIIERADGVQDHASLEALPNQLTLAPGQASVSPGEAQAYTAREVSALGSRDLGQVEIGPNPSEAKLSIDPDGACDQVAQTCTPAEPGRHTVTVRPGAPIIATPGTATLTAGHNTIEITPSALPPAVAGAWYQVLLTAVGAKDENVNWRITAGTVPDGIEFGTEGRWAGFCCSVTSLDPSSVTVLATDSEGAFGERTYQFDPGPPACTADPCVEALGPIGEVTVSWEPICNCGEGDSLGYYLAPYINGVWGGTFGQFLLGPWGFFPNGRLYQSHGRVWASWNNAFGSPEFPYRTNTGDSVYVKVGAGPRNSTFSEVLEHWTNVGTTNTVAVE